VRPAALRLAVALLVAGLLGGCGASQFQTARTLPMGAFGGYAGISFVGNEQFKQRDVSVYNFQPDYGFRYGILNGLELDINQIFVAGLQVAVKATLVPPEGDFALSVKGGIGAAADLGDFGEAWLLEIPVTLLASYRFGPVEPYVGIGYNFFWIFGRSLTNPPPNAVDEERKGYGDGVIRATVGLDIPLTERVGLLVEYTFMPAVVNDPGDNFAFVDNHIGSIGVRF
jgi:outer membrane protein W